MTEQQTFSQNGGRDLLESKGILGEIHEIPSICVEHPSQHNYSERSEALENLGGWQTQVQVDLGPEQQSHKERLTPFLDAYHHEHQVAVEQKRRSRCVPAGT